MKNKKSKPILDKRSELEKCVCFNLRKAGRVITQIYDEKMRSCGLRSTQISILVITAIVESAPITRLANMLVMERTTLTRNLKPLEKQELISIDHGIDQRTRVVTLTDKGYKKMEEVLPLWDEAQSYVTKKLGLAKRDGLLNNLSEVISIAEKG